MPDSEAAHSPAKQQSGVLAAIRRSEMLRSFLGIALVVLVVKGCVIDQYTVPSSSMHPTLQGDSNFLKDDRILVNKWVYGPRIPFTTTRLWKWGAPKRWDIVVFRTVEPDSTHDILVKRVAGLPGERVQLKDGSLYINGEAVAPPEADRENINYADGKTWREAMRGFIRFIAENGPVDIYNPQSPGVKELREDVAKLRPQLLGKNVEAMPFGEIEAYCAQVRKSSISLILELLNRQLPEAQYGIGEEDAFTLVPEGHYFMLGDNGPVSLDGRFYGWVPHSNLYGPAFAIWWPYAHWRDFSGFSATWWGKLLLYGIPLILVALEVRHYIRERKRRRATKA